MGIFENFILREANQTSQPPLPKMPNQPQARPEKQDLPPDATAYDAAGNPQGQGAGATEVDPNATAGGDPNAGGGDVGGDAAGDPGAQGDPNADPNAGGGDVGGDAAGDPGGDPNAGGGDVGGDAAGDPGADPNAQGDPNADPNAAGGEVPQSPGFDQDEQKLFADLKPEQMDIKIKELKTQFRNLHIAVEHTIDKINKVSPTTYDAEMLDVIIRKLIFLRRLIRDSVSETFQTRTYIENKQEFQRFANIFNNIGYLLDEIYKSRMKRKEDAEVFAKKRSKFEKKNDFPFMFSTGYDLQ